MDADEWLIELLVEKDLGNLQERGDPTGRERMSSVFQNAHPPDLIDPRICSRTVRLSERGADPSATNI
jgi:hypothetical protein